MMRNHWNSRERKQKLRDPKGTEENPKYKGLKNVAERRGGASLYCYVILDNTWESVTATRRSLKNTIFVLHLNIPPADPLYVTSSHNLTDGWRATARRWCWSTQSWSKNYADALAVFLHNSLLATLTYALMTRVFLIFFCHFSTTNKTCKNPSRIRLDTHWSKQKGNADVKCRGLDMWRFCIYFARVSTSRFCRGNVIARTTALCSWRSVRANAFFIHVSYEVDHEKRAYKRFVW